MGFFKQSAGVVFFRTMKGLSTLGERWGSEWLIYNPLVHLAFERSARRNAPPLVKGIRRLFPHAKRVVDVGCGTGRFAAEFQSEGYEVEGYEYSAKLRRQAAKRGIGVSAFDLSTGVPTLPPRLFDIALSTEVAEHIPAEFAETLAHFLLNCAPVVVFTAAQPGQGGTGHINEKPREYWIEVFTNAGATYEPDMTSKLAASLEASKTQAFMYHNLSVFRSPASRTA